jgi:hypothetical protein
MMSATWHLVQEERDTTRDTTRPGNTSEHKYIQESPMSHRYPCINRRELSAPILSDEEEEEAAALPGSPQNLDVKSESNEEDITIDSREDLASSSARRTVLGDSAHHTPKAQALIAHGLAAVYGASDSGEILELTDAYEAAFAVAALKAKGVNCRHSGGRGKRQETMHSVVYTPGGRGKRQETMLCSVTTPKLIY